MAIEFEIPVHTVTESNSGGHFWAKAKRAKAQRELALTHALAHGAHRGRWILPATITLTRVAPRRLDIDNAWSSVKHLIDGIAQALGKDDGDPRLTWVVEQRKGAPREYCVHVRVECV